MSDPHARLRATKERKVTTMITKQEMERLATIGQLCWGCDNAPTFEDSRYCEACTFEEVSI